MTSSFFSCAWRMLEKQVDNVLLKMFPDSLSQMRNILENTGRRRILWVSDCVSSPAALGYLIGSGAVYILKYICESITKTVPYWASAGGSWGMMVNSKPTPCPLCCGQYLHHKCWASVFFSQGLESIGNRFFCEGSLNTHVIGLFGWFVIGLFGMIW